MEMQIDINTIVEKYKSKLSDVVGVNVILESQVELLFKENESLRERVAELEEAKPREKPEHLLKRAMGDD